MSTPKILRVAKRDAAILDLLAERPRAIASASLRTQRHYDRLMQKGWATLVAGDVTLTLSGYRAHLSSKVPFLRSVQNVKR